MKDINKIPKGNTKKICCAELNKLNIARTLFGALCSPWKGRFSYSPGSVNGSPPDDLSRARLEMSKKENFESVKFKRGSFSVTEVQKNNANPTEMK